ncbi:MAG: hypothetical protein R3C45_19690 [Phycisphaerales bacterium]
MTSAIEATASARVEVVNAVLTFTDRSLVTSKYPKASPADGVSSSRSPAEGIDAYLGPFVIDYTHPLSAGLSLAGLVWAAPGH